MMHFRRPPNGWPPFFNPFARGKTGATTKDPVANNSVAAMVKERGKLLFEDDFNRKDSGDKDDLGPDWATNSDGHARGDKQNDLVNFELVMTISPLADHAISTNHEMKHSDADAVLAVRMKLDDGEFLKLADDDNPYEEVHAGYIIIHLSVPLSYACPLELSP